MRDVQRDRVPVSERPEVWALDDVVRRRRLRSQARRPLAVNLAEGLALCELLGSFRGAARR